MIWLLALNFFGIALAQEDTAALIIGGRSFYDGDDVLYSVELFGCDNSPVSIRVDDLPYETYLTSGVYLPEKEAVLTCGGKTCLRGDSPCAPTNQCYYYHGINGFQEAPRLGQSSYAQLIALGPNLKEPLSMGLTPIAIGQNIFSEVFSANLNDWSDYNSLTNSDWSAENCLVQEGNIIYLAEGSTVTALHLDTWEFEVLVEIWGTFRHLGKCAMIKDRLGEPRGK